MNLDAVLRGRRSCRNFLDDSIPTDVLDVVLSAALRAPSAGNSWALDLLVLEGSDETASYWDVTLAPGPRREKFRWPGLLRAPVLVIPTVRSQSYVERYAEADKSRGGDARGGGSRAGLGDSIDGWSVPYWFVDGGASIMAMLLAATDAGLATLLFGQFDHAPAVAATFGIPDDRVALGTVAIGRAAAEQTPGRSALRGRPQLVDIVHRSRW